MTTFQHVMSYTERTAVEAQQVRRGFLIASTIAMVLWAALIVTLVLVLA